MKNKPMLPPLPLPVNPVQQRAMERGARVANGQTVANFGASPPDGRCPTCGHRGFVKNEQGEKICYQCSTLAPPVPQVEFKPQHGLKFEDLEKLPFTVHDARGRWFGR